MNVYDKAHELARTLKVSPEVMEYKRALEKINGSETNKKMVEDFRKKQMEIYTLQMQGKEPSKEQKDGIENLYRIISLNPDVREYLEAEAKFSTIWQDILEIIGDAVGLNEK